MSVLRRSEVLEILGRHKAELADRYGITSLGVFGSVARDEAGEESDVDVVYETSTPNLFRTVRMKRELEAILRRRVDVVRWRERINPRLKARIAREAVYV
jgi:predicted nucleotidyltransferase